MYLHARREAVFQSITKHPRYKYDADKKNTFDYKYHAPKRDKKPTDILLIWNGGIET